MTLLEPTWSRTVLRVLTVDHLALIAPRRPLVMGMRFIDAL